jgi:hypothetical protein
MLFTKLEWRLLFLKFRAMESKSQIWLLRIARQDSKRHLPDGRDHGPAALSASAYWTIRVQASCSALYCSSKALR